MPAPSNEQAPPQQANATPAPDFSRTTYPTLYATGTHMVAKPGDNNGAITANVAAGCNATVGANTVVLTVMDGNGGTAKANLTASRSPKTSNGR